MQRNFLFLKEINLCLTGDTIAIGQHTIEERTIHFRGFIKKQCLAGNLVSSTVILRKGNLRTI